MLDPFWVVLGLAALYTLITKLGFGFFAEKILTTYAMIFQRRSHGDFIRSWGELREARRLLSEISAQDEFAKWARQQRTVDRLQAQHDQLAGERQRALLAKSMGLSLTLRLLLYGGLFYYLNVRLLGSPIACYGSELLGPLASVLAIPRCSAGCISPSLLFTISAVAMNRLVQLSPPN